MAQRALTVHALARKAAVPDARPGPLPGKPAPRRSVFRSSLRAVLFAPLFLLAAGCATVGELADTSGDIVRAGSAEPLAPFDLTGRISVRHEDKGFSGNVRWQARETTDDLWLGSPLGQVMAQLHRDAGGAVLTTAEQRQYRAASLEGLARDALGWALPVASLRYWVSGRLAPDADARILERDAAGRPVLYVQHAWSVRITDHAEGTARPRRLQLHYGDLEVRLVIDAFEVPSAGGASR